MTAGSELERIYREDGARLWRALLAFAGDRDVANDAVAEAFAQALGRGTELRDPQRWIWRAAFRIAAGELKERRRFGAAIDAGYEMPEPPARLVAGLARLSPNQRAALVLHYYGGYPTKDIAGVIGASAATVRVHLSQGRKRLRRILEESDD